jgi:hypothetical protein
MCRLAEPDFDPAGMAPVTFSAKSPSEVAGDTVVVATVSVVVVVPPAVCGKVTDAVSVGVALVSVPVVGGIPTVAKLSEAVLGSPMTVDWDTNLTVTIYDAVVPRRTVTSVDATDTV